jgi:hypothetical protein
VSSPPPVNSYQKRAVTAYGTASTQSKSERELMAEAMRMVINNLTLARDTYNANKFEDMLEHNKKTLKILDVLREELVGSGAINDPEARPAASFLLRTYRDLILRVTDVLTMPSPADEYNTLIELVTQLYRKWQTPPATPQPPSQPTAPIAG